MRYQVKRMCDLNDRQFKTLRGLTSCKTRGDLTDDGSPAGSDFLERINMHVHGVKKFSHDSWAVMSFDWFRCSGWCLLSRRFRVFQGDLVHVPTFSVGFYVLPDYRKKGLGKCLLREASEVARKNGGVRLLATPWNARSISFFKSAGFVDFIPLFPGLSEPQMVLNISPSAKP